jgi:hypothetical protein
MQACLPSVITTNDILFIMATPLWVPDH